MVSFDFFFFLDKTLNQNQQNGKAAALNSTTESDYVVIHSDSQQVEVTPKKPADTPETEEADKHEDRVQFFDKIFKKKAEREAPVEAESVVEEETHQNIVRDTSLPATDAQLVSIFHVRVRVRGHVYGDGCAVFCWDNFGGRVTAKVSGLFLTGMRKQF